jgi:hypothetical protein
MEPRCLNRYSDRIDGPGFDFLQGQEIFLYFTAVRPALGGGQPSLISFLQGLKRPNREADQSPSCAYIRNGGIIPPLRRTF